MKIYIRKKTFGVVLCGQPIFDRITGLKGYAMKFIWQWNY